MSDYIKGQPVKWLQVEFGNGKKEVVLHTGTVERTFPKVVIVLREGVRQGIFRRYLRSLDKAPELEAIKEAML